MDGWMDALGILPSNLASPRHFRHCPFYMNFNTKAIFP